MSKKISQKAKELEKYFSGKEGIDYTNRNMSSLKTGHNSATLIYNIIKMGNIQSVLEIGTNLGVNLSKLENKVSKICGTDINEEALKTAKSLYPFVDFKEGSVYDLPYQDDEFELVFTRGVIIHINPDDRIKALKELVRVSSRFIVNIEYECEDERLCFEPVSWRENQTLWRINVEKYLKDIKGIELKEKMKVPLSLDKENMTIWIAKKV